MERKTTGSNVPLRRVLLAMAILAWCAFVVTAYYISHKPADPQQIAALARLAVTWIGWLGSLALAHGLGRRLAPAFDRLPVGQRFALRIGVGLGVISLGTLALGAVGGLWRPVPWVLIVVGAPLSARELWSDLHQLIRIPIRGRADRLLAGFVGVTLVLAVLPALAPPIAWDALVYHLTGPKLYIAAHHLVHHVDIPHLGFPQAAEMLFTWGMLLSRPELAQLFHATFAVLTLLLLGSITQDFAPGRGWLAAALLAAVPSAMTIAGWAYVEWMTMFAGLASLTILVYAAEGQADPTTAGSQSEGPGSGATQGRGVSRTDVALWCLAGFFGAQMLSTKYTAIAVGAGLLAYAAWRLRPVRAVVIYAGSVTIFTAPYLLKNWVLTGNPVYPFFFPGVFWDSLRQAFYSRPGTGLGPLQLLLAPWEATIWGIDGGFAVGHPSYAATLGPLLLALIPLVLLLLTDRRRRGSWTGALLLASGAMYVFWLIGLASSHLLLQSRLLFPALPMFVGLAVIGYDTLDRLEWPGFSIRFVVGGLMAIVFALTVLSSGLGFVAANPLAVITGAESQARFHETRLGLYAWVMDRINQLPAGSRVVFLWEPRSYACSTDIVCDPDDITDRWWHMRRLGKTASEVADEWRAQGVTHILYYAYGAGVIRDAGLDPYAEDDWTELDRFINEDLTPLETWGDAYVLYRLR